jgi:hypothetical protein
MLPILVRFLGTAQVVNFTDVEDGRNTSGVRGDTIGFRVARTLSP